GDPWFSSWARLLAGACVRRVTDGSQAVPFVISGGCPRVDSILSLKRNPKPPRIRPDNTARPDSRVPIERALIGDGGYDSPLEARFDGRARPYLQVVRY